MKYVLQSETTLFCVIPLSFHPFVFPPVRLKTVYHEPRIARQLKILQIC